MSFSWAPGHEPPDTEAIARRALVARLARVRAALAAVLGAPTLSTDPRTAAAVSALEDGARGLLLQHRPDLCPTPPEGT